MNMDYDLHGIVGVRLLDAAPADAAAVGRQLGAIQMPLDRDPDIVIRFVDRVPTSAAPRFLGRDEAGFTDDAFYVLRSKHRTGVMVRIPFGEIGGRCEIECERGVPAVPWLIPTINLTALAHGVVPLHASAFQYNGRGVIVTGWSKGGKTETLLSFMAQGARYIGDEWVYIRDDRRVCGIPEPIRLWDWHLRELPGVRSKIGLKQRARLRVLKLLRSICSVTTAPLFARTAQLLQRQSYVDVAPEILFGNGVKAGTSCFDRVFFVVSHDSPEVRIEPMESQEVARRMSYSLAYERREFMALYRMFRFAFPDVENKWLERAEQIERELLLHVFEDKPVYAVYHPYPVSIPALFEAMLPLMDAGADRPINLGAVESSVVRAGQERVVAL